jgi:branched-chain amino acid transport system substrate-binding protein
MKQENPHRMKPLLAALALVTAIGSAHAEDKTLTIGCSLPLSGRMVGFGHPIEQGMQLAVDDFNASKKLPGAHFVLDCNDSQGDPKETVNIADRLIDNKSVFISLSDFTSTSTMAAADTYAKAGLVQLTPSASHPDLVKMNKWMFRTSETVPTYVDPLADFTVDKLHAKRVAVIQVQTDWGQSVGQTFIAELKKDGGTVTNDEVYNEGTTDFRAILTDLRRSKPEAIFLAMLEEEAATFMKQRKQLGLTSIPVVDSGVGVTDRSLKLAGDAFNGMYSSRLYNPERDTPEVKTFVTNFTKKYGKAPDIWSAYGYDAANVAMLAAQRAWPDVTRDNIRQQLDKLGHVQGANGELAIDPKTRDVVRFGLTTIRVEDGKVNYSPKL